MSIFDLSAFKMNPVSDGRFVIKGEKYRITVLTEQMLRLEYSEDGVFEDRATRLAFDRAFDTPAYDTYTEDGILHVVTKHLHLRYDGKRFSENGMQIFVDGTGDWRYGAKLATLGGTVRTLDTINGATPLGDGLVSTHQSFTTLDDSKTIAISEDGWPVPVTGDRIDLYFFGYGRNYEKCISDFYKLSAPVPLLPRYALGNWWSRYHAYTDAEYRELMDKFEEKDIPFSVAVIDMDWHITETPDREKYGSGWTGYTWNRKLFPDPGDFLRDLHRRGLKTTLNLHPRDGIRAYEEAYPEFCKYLGREADGKQIEFDASDRRFMDGYFRTVLNALEEQGVDFWWIDWQQKGGYTVPGYDVLWMLNHCHYADSTRRGERGLLFSRYAGPGSHRYPTGFSGDTHVTWESLAFQPYFTSTAANIGYSWWSHDIGGHMGGYHNHELQTRWVQFGVFSPINRLHSTANPFNSKEPWKYGECEGIISDYLRLRHRLIPYIYTMMYRGYTDGIPMLRPMYHKYSRESGAFAVKNEYLFGELIVSPITEETNKQSGLASAEVWLPTGNYIDFFNGRIYSGNRRMKVLRRIDAMPVFAKAGCIVPLAANDGGNSTENPKKLEICVFGGDNGTFTMIEDNGKCGSALEVARTAFGFSYGESSVLSFVPDACSTVPEIRDYKLRFVAFTKPTALTASVNGKAEELSFEFDERTHTVTAELCGIKAGDNVAVTLAGDGKLPENDIVNTAYEILEKAQCGYDEKTRLMNLVRKNTSAASRIQELMTLKANPDLVAAMIELLSAD
ncbi:MAG: alpha-xylosidase [Clostridia bacterium]|nr:alpha-xylosidase [Clostridia bacterium]